MPNIFICYRREQSIAMAGRIGEYLAREFGSKSLFMDVEQMPIGRDFRQTLEVQVAKCDVMLVIIDEGWAEITNDEGNRRLDDPADFVRIEIETGLKRENVIVVPVLIDDTPMLKPDDLPYSLRDLAYRHAAVVRYDPGFNWSMERLAKQIRNQSKDVQARAAAPRPRRIAPARRWALVIALIVALVTLGAAAALGTGVIDLDSSDSATADPTGAAFMLREGNRLFQEQKYNEAIEAYSRAINLDPKNFEAYYYRGICYGSMENYEQAIEDYSHVIELNPDFVVVYANRGHSYMNLGDYGQSVEDLLIAVKAMPDDYNVHWGLGNSYFGLGLFHKSLQHYREYLSLVDEEPRDWIVARVEQIEALLEPLGDEDDLQFVTTEDTVDIRPTLGSDDPAEIQTTPGQEYLVTGRDDSGEWVEIAYHNVELLTLELGWLPVEEINGLDDLDRLPVK
jgi:tetratricopeptide (TPR) repeat protein